MDRNGRFFAGTMDSQESGPNGALYGNILEHQFGATGTWALGSAMGVVLFLVSLALIWLIWKTVNLRRVGFTGGLAS